MYIFIFKRDFLDLIHIFIFALLPRYTLGRKRKFRTTFWCAVESFAHVFLNYYETKVFVDCKYTDSELGDVTFDYKIEIGF